MKLGGTRGKGKKVLGPQTEEGIVNMIRRGGREKESTDDELQQGNGSKTFLTKTIREIPKK